MACSSVLTAFAVATLLALVATQVHSVAVTTNGWSQSGGDAQNTGRFRGQLRYAAAAATAPNHSPHSHFTPSLPQLG